VQVLGRMKQLMVDNNTAASHSFLLDDDSSIPFSLDDIQNLMDEKVSNSSDMCAMLCWKGVCKPCVLGRGQEVFTNGLTAFDDQSNGLA